jgi:hypothetical protein
VCRRVRIHRADDAEIVGETAGVTKPAVVFPNGQVVESEVKYNRFSYGAGMTLAAGWKALFLTLDANWTSGEIISKQNGQVGDEPIQTLTFTPRLGTLISSGQLGTGAIWVGGMFLAATSEIHDRLAAGLSDFSARIPDEGDAEICCAESACRHR